jgi:hypothetical protein
MADHTLQMCLYGGCCVSVVGGLDTDREVVVDALVHVLIIVLVDVVRGVAAG